MGTTGLPHIFVDAESEIPSASKWNDNFKFLNFAHLSLIRNGDFESFSGPTPVSWTLDGVGAISASDADSKRSALAVKVTSGASAQARLRQDAYEFKSLKSRFVKAWCWVKTSTPNIARLQITDGVATTVSAFHSGSGAYQLLEVTQLVAAGATTVRLNLLVEQGGGFALFDAAVLVDFEDARGFLLDIPDFSNPASEITAGRINISGTANAPPTANQITKESSAKAWVKFTGSNGAITGSLNITSVVRNATGQYTITWDTDFTNANYCVFITANRSSSSDGTMTFLTSQAAGSITIETRIRSGQLTDFTDVYVVAFGLQ